MARVLTLKASCCRRHLTQNIYKPSSALQSLQRLSSTNASNTETDAEPTFEDFDEMEEEERIQRLQDISGLSEALKRRLHGQVPEIVNDYQRSVRYAFQQEIIWVMVTDTGVFFFLSLDAHKHFDDYSGTLGGVRKVHFPALVTSLNFKDLSE